MFNLLHVVVNDNDIAKDITQLLWHNKISHVVVRRGIEELNSHSEKEESAIIDPGFNDLPLIIETVINEQQTEELSNKLKTLVPESKGQVDIIPGIVGEEEKMTNQFVNMKCFIHPEERWMAEKNYEKVLKVFQKHNVDWATVTKGLAGYGENTLKKFAEIEEFVHLDERIPVIIEAIVPENEVNDIIQEAKPLFTDGVIFTTPINVVDKNI